MCHLTAGVTVRPGPEHSVPAKNSAHKTHTAQAPACRREGSLQEPGDHIRCTLSPSLL